MSILTLSEIVHGMCTGSITKEATLDEAEELFLPNCIFPVNISACGCVMH